MRMHRWVEFEDGEVNDRRKGNAREQPTVPGEDRTRRDGGSSRTRFRRRCMSPWLRAILAIQDPKRLWFRSSGRLRHACRKTSWTRSSASQARPVVPGDAGHEAAVSIDEDTVSRGVAAKRLLDEELVSCLLAQV
jgi:hypothetical protein